MQMFEFGARFKKWVKKSRNMADQIYMKTISILHKD
jgi:hypothetical protein